MPQLTIDQRVSIGMAARRYIRACERFAEATGEFETASDELREVTPPALRFVATDSHRHWLIEVNRDGDLDAERIECL